MPTARGENVGVATRSAPAQAQEVVATVDISVEQAAGLVMIRVRGELDTSTASELDVALHSARAEPVDLLVDLCGVDFLDCAGVHVLAAAAADQAEAGNHFAIACCPRGLLARVFKALAAAGLELPVHDSRADALLAALATPQLPRTHHGVPSVRWSSGSGS
jgi:anti-anti-sigma factor